MVSAAALPRASPSPWSSCLDDAADMRAPFVLSGTPAGDRLIFEVQSGTIEGPRLRA